MKNFFSGLCSFALVLMLSAGAFAQGLPPAAGFGSSGAGGGLAGVTTDSTLTGNGTSGTPLKIAPPVQFQVPSGGTSWTGPYLLGCTQGSGTGAQTFATWPGAVTGDFVTVAAAMSAISATFAATGGAGVTTHRDTDRAVGSDKLNLWTRTFNGDTAEVVTPGSGNVNNALICFWHKASGPITFDTFGTTVVTSSPANGRTATFTTAQSNEIITFSGIASGTVSFTIFSPWIMDITAASGTAYPVIGGFIGNATASYAPIPVAGAIAGAYFHEVPAPASGETIYAVGLF